jgi:phage baseplate assembly protein V
MISLRDKHDIAQAFERHTKKLRGRIRGLATRFVLGKATRAVDDLARVRGETYSGDATDDDELMQNYGFASMPVNGAEGVRVSVFGDGDHGVIVVLDDRRYRPTLEDGEVAAYHKDGAIVHMKNDGGIVVVPSGTGLVHVGADPASDFVALAALVLTRLQTIKTDFDAHIHPDPVSGNTGVPTVPMTTPTAVAATKAKAT